MVQQMARSVLRYAGDSVGFLKRRHTLLDNHRMLLLPSEKRFDKLFKLLGIHAKSAIKKTPYASILDDVDQSDPLNTHDAQVFRCAIGVLLYLSVDLLECQSAIRALATKMTCPTANSMTALIHLVKYLRGAQHQGVLLQHTHHGLRIVIGQLPRRHESLFLQAR